MPISSTVFLTTKVFVSLNNVCSSFRSFTITFLTTFHSNFIFYNNNNNNSSFASHTFLANLLEAVVPDVTLNILLKI